MNQQAAAIIIAGALIAAAIALTNHWQLQGGENGGLLLNRWTGTIAICGGIKLPEWEATCPPTNAHTQQPAK
jgi:hypothetical protein